MKQITIELPLSAECDKLITFVVNYDPKDKSDCAIDGIFYNGVDISDIVEAWVSTKEYANIMRSIYDEIGMLQQAQLEYWADMNNDEAAL